MSDNREQWDSALEEKFYATWTNLLNKSPLFSLLWHEATRVMYKNIVKLNFGNTKHAELDMFYLTGLFVEFGKQAFKEINRESPRTPEKILVVIAKRYRIKEDPTITEPMMSITDLVKHFSFYIAEHLHSGKGRTFGNLRLLPRCLAFPGGLQLIPLHPRYIGLTVAWKMWSALLPDEEMINSPFGDYLKIFYVSFKVPVRDRVMKFLDVTPLTDKDVLKSIEGVVKETESSNVRDLGVFQRIFPHYSEDIFSFYETTLQQLRQNKNQSKKTKM